MKYAPPVLAPKPANNMTCGIDWAGRDHAISIVMPVAARSIEAPLSTTLSGCEFCWVCWPAWESAR
uniref:hypothetical protein n=1 Tax=Mycolicibacterium baixiangningiae TaxID=2761578 RepID=UPI001E329319|nr:hypothetical protein [Mycolicibacterium baixiangningiae]